MPTNGADVLATSSDGEVLNGLAGDDILTSTFNNTTLIGSDGDDQLDTNLYYLLGQVASAAAIQIGGGGHDRLSATIGIAGADATITQDGGNGDDQISASFYGSEVDFLSVNLVAGVDGGAGNDAIDLSANLMSIDASVFNTVSGGAGDDRITIAGQTFRFGVGSSFGNNVDGGAGNDLIQVTLSDTSNGAAGFGNSINGGGGDDHILIFESTSTNTSVVPTTNRVTGGQGNDTIEAYFTSSFGDFGATVTNDFTGGAGDDLLVAATTAQGSFSSSVVHRLNGGIGQDTLRSRVDAFAESFDITAQLIGEAGNDKLESTVSNSAFTISHGSVDNLVEGGAGNDVLNGGIAVSSSLEFYADLDLQNRCYGGAGNDTLQVSLSLQVDDSVVDIPTTIAIGTNDLAGGFGNDSILATVDIIKTSPFTTYLAASHLSGGNGADQLTVVGGDGNTLDGGNGNDRLVGGDGRDTFTGGPGSELFVLTGTGSNPTNPDVITDFNARQGDRIDITALGITPAHLTIAGSAGSYTASADLDGNGAPDFVLAVTSAQPLTTSAFLF